MSSFSKKTSPLSDMSTWRCVGRCSGSGVIDGDVRGVDQQRISKYITSSFARTREGTKWTT